MFPKLMVEAIIVIMIGQCGCNINEQANDCYCIRCYYSALDYFSALDNYI
jgi:hypothetical protein